jgi:hypothetical protein
LSRERQPHSSPQLNDWCPEYKLFVEEPHQQQTNAMLTVTLSQQQVENIAESSRDRNMVLATPGAPSMLCNKTNLQAA